MRFNIVWVGILVKNALLFRLPVLFSNFSCNTKIICCVTLVSQGLFVHCCGYIVFLHFSLLVSMAPLSNEIRPVTSCCPPHIGPAVPEVNSVWFKLFIYDQVKSGPPSLLLVKGTRLTWLPKIFEVGMKGRDSSLHTSQVAHQAGVYPGFCCMKPQGQEPKTRSISTPPVWFASPMQGYPSALNSPVPIYTPEWREAL